MWLTPRAKRVSAQSVGQAQSEGLAMSMRGQASRPSQASQQDGSQIDLTPMLDVVFIMLIFFIVTSSFVKEPGVEIFKPQATTTEVCERGTIIFAVDERGDIYYNKNKQKEFKASKMVKIRMIKQGRKMKTRKVEAQCQH